MSRKSSILANLLIVERNAQATIVEEHVSLTDGVSVSQTRVTELIAAENSVISHVMISERESSKTFHISTLRIQQERDANVSSHSVLIGGALVRNNVHPVLAWRRRPNA